ncbi:tyrosine-protein kinase domain-containing protein [Leptolyngbya sp. BC1307]|uniref:GumC family protein n=1 Tax=Leptolyngbya sp. BC1307 TaxID=2029589 RepID=UPI000EFC8453|nr:tyrosine-protein kinase domain-containing protein [Leptolyngbya sp. BC1307]
MASPFIKRYLLALNRYKWPGLFTFLSILGASSVVAFQPEPPQEYYSEGVLVNNSPLVAFSDTSAQVQDQGLGIINEDLLLSDVLLNEVSAELRSLGIDLTPAELVESTRIAVVSPDEEETSPGLRQRVTVRFVGQNPEVTETVLNVMFQAMVELSQATNRARLGAITTELDKRLPAIEADLRETEQDLEAYDRIEGPAIQASIDGSLLSGITGSQQEQRNNLITLAGIDAQMRSIQSQLGMTPDQAYASSALSADPLVAQLRAQISEAETQRALLRSQGRRDSFPAVEELNNNLATYQQLLQQRASEVLRGDGNVAPIPSGTQTNLDPARAALANQLVALDTQRDALLSQQQVLGQSAQALRQQYADLPNKQLERNRLEQQVALRRALYDRLQASRVDAEAAAAETVSSLTVSNPPFTVPNEQDRPAPIVILLAGALTGLIAGGGVVYLLDMLDGTVRTAEELEEMLQDQEVPMLGIIPAMKTRSARAVPILVQPDSIYHNSYERLLSRLRLVGNEESSIGPRMIVLTSTRSQEGKSVSAYNLAIASARAGRRTLLVEADLRSGSKAEILGLGIDPQTILEPLRYYSGQVGNNAQMISQVENLYVCPSPGPQSQPAGILESSEMQRFLKDARSRFDMVVLDTPSLTRCDDALLLEEQTDGIVLVTRPGITEKAVLATALEELELSDEVRLLGAVINAVSMSTAQAADLGDRTVDDPATLSREPEFSGAPSGRIDF